MATSQNIRTKLTMPEVAVHLGWSEHDLRDAIISGRITPSYYVNMGIWAYDVDASGALKKRTPAIFKNEWLYTIRFKQTAQWDGHFEYLADTPEAFDPGSIIYQLVGNSMVREHVLSLSDVLARGVVTAAELDRFASSCSTAQHHPNSVNPQGQNPQWWNREYFIVQMADAEMATRAASGFGANQNGSRAGKHPLSSIALALSHQVNKREKDAERKRTIGAKSIENFLRAVGWD